MSNFPRHQIVAVVGASVIFFLGVCLCVRSKRGRTGGRSSKRGAYQQTNGNDDQSSRTDELRPNPDAAVAERNRNSTAANVDRNTSVRSVMTLPAYRTKANDSEQVLGREGERDGVDVVVDLPNVADDESLRDEEMEALYQIRLARRLEIAEREERRRLRREARARGDSVALGELSERARAASSSSVVTDLREEHQRIKNQRQRAVSSVSYGDLGVARLDGTRLRASSQESERMGLLSDAASIALSTRSPSSLSIRSPSALSHRRDRSASSVLSFDSTQDFPSPGLPRSGATTPRRLSAQHTGGTAGSSPEMIGEADLGDNDMPPHSPPGYDEVSLDDARSGATTPAFNEPPPDYSDPTGERDRRLSAHVADMVGSVGDEGDLSDRRSSRASERSARGLPPLPHLSSLRMGGLPQIVVQPSSAHPRDSSSHR